MGVNYIASAGTGKTYSLITQVIKLITTGKARLKEVMILTFTEKAASELKESLSRRIENLLSDETFPEEQKKLLHQELIYTNSGYIGTFHSVFFRILKAYPQHTHIDASYKVLTSELDIFLETAFRKWSEEELENLPEKDQLLQLFGGNSWQIKKIFFSLYKSREKTGKLKENIDEIRQEKEVLTEKSKKLVENILSQYGDRLEKLYPYPSVFRNDPKRLLERLKTGNVERIKSADRPAKTKTFLLKAKSTKKIPEEIGKTLKELNKDEEFKKLDAELFGLLHDLYVNEGELRARVVYRAYKSFEKTVEKLKKEEKAIDFTDILLKTEELLLKNKEVLKALRRRFKYLFVDEFQDTDPVQARILKMLNQENIYIYGDPKQCIYTWRDADLQAYFDFIKSGGFKENVLDTNYRSSRKLVEFVNELLENEKLLKDMDINYKKAVKHKRQEEKESIERYIILLEKDSKKENGQLQALFTLQKVVELTKEGYEYRDIMVLFRKNNELKEFKKLFLQHGIPVVSPGDTTFFEQKEIKSVLTLLHHISNPEDRLKLLHLLKEPYNLSTDQEIYNSRDKLQALVDKQIKKILSDGGKELYGVIDLIYQNTEVFETVCMVSETPFAHRFLQKLQLVAKQKALEGYSLQDFISWSENAELSIPEDGNGVVFLTMHKAKGLESPVVIIPLLEKLGTTSANSRNGEVVSTGDRLLFYYPAEMVISQDWEKYRETIKKERENEEERLFYVAITRARDRLIFVESGETQSKFTEVVASSPHVKTITVKPDGIKAVKLKENTLPPELLEEKKKKVEKRYQEIENLYKNAEGELRYASVSILMEKEGKINYGGKETGAYIGTLVHAVLQEMDFKNYSKEEVDRLLKRFINLIPEEYRQEVENESRQILSNIDFLIKEMEKATVLFREMPFVMEDGGIIIEGVIDLIYRKGGRIFVVDYKTNRIREEGDKEKLFEYYKTQGRLYLKAVKKLSPREDVIFRLAFLRDGTFYPD